MTRNYRPGSKCLSGMVHRQTGPVSYEVTATPGDLIWRRHVDQLRPRPDQLEQRHRSRQKTDTTETEPMTEQSRKQIAPFGAAKTSDEADNDNSFSNTANQTPLEDPPDMELLSWLFMLHLVCFSFFLQLKNYDIN